MDPTGLLSFSGFLNDLTGVATAFVVGGICEGSTLRIGTPGCFALGGVAGIVKWY